jgi:predicted O-methyltransferase YrrM
VGGAGPSGAYAARVDADLPWSDWSLEPASCDLLCDEVGAGRREVVECGSGVSTVLLARALRDAGGGRLHALEHDGNWSDTVRELLAREGLERIATVVVAPLGSHPLARAACGWYDGGAIEGLPRDGIDLLLVDGPPAAEPGLGEARYPALPALTDRLSAGALVALDDVDRPGETAVLAAWERETAFRFDRVGGTRLALGSRRAVGGIRG